MAAEQWFYRSEGNNNVIFTDTSNSLVLRLPKIARTAHNQGLKRSQRSEITHEIEFLEHVVYKILKDVHIQYKGEKMPLTKEFIHILSEKMKGKRPEKYQNETLDESIKYGLVLPNFCRLLVKDIACSFKSPTIVPRLHNAPTISIELRPKTCYFPDFEKPPCAEIQGKCFFCLRKLYHTISQSEVMQTKYCPLDLYSGRKARIKRALSDLISCPQRYFSVRIDDEDVFSNVILRKKASECNLSGSKKALNQNCFDQAVSSHFGRNGRESFLNILAEALLTPVLNNFEETAQLPEVKQHCRRKGHISYDNGCSLNSNSNSSILAFLATVHRMRYLPLHDLVKLHQMVKSHVEIHEEDAELLSLQSPYNVRSWEKAAKLSNANGKKTFFNKQKANNQLEAVEAAEKLRRFKIGRGFSCCSLIITLRRIESSISQLEIGNSIAVSDGYGNSYLASISIVDLYKDLPSKVETYYNRELSIIEFLNNHYTNSSR